MCHEITSHYIPIVWLKLMTLISFLHMANRCVSRDQHMRSRAVCSATHGQ
jgi:hypothetical protein